MCLLHTTRLLFYIFIIQYLKLSYMVFYTKKYLKTIKDGIFETLKQTNTPSFFIVLHFFNSQLLC
jgi:hypothetical protein